MKLRFGLLAVLPLALVTGAAHADFPLMNMVGRQGDPALPAVELPAAAGEAHAAKSEQEQRVVQLMKKDPQLRKAFLDKIAAPSPTRCSSAG